MPGRLRRDWNGRREDSRGEETTVREEKRGTPFDAKLRDWPIRLRLILCHVPLSPSLSVSTRTLSNIVGYLRSDARRAKPAREIAATKSTIRFSAMQI